MHTALCLAARHGDKHNVVHMLRGKHVPAESVDKRGTPALHHAVQYGHADIARVLLAEGAHPMQRSAERHATALHQLAWSVSVSETQHSNARAVVPDKVVRQLCALLLRNGADPAARDGSGNTPLHLAARWGHAGMIEVLVDQGGVSPCAVGGGQAAAARRLGDRPALMVAAEHGRTAAVRMLARKGAALNAADECGKTAAFFAACGGHGGAVAELLRAGADAGMSDAKGRAPVLIAHQHGHSEVVSLLERAGHPIADAQAVFDRLNQAAAVNIAGGEEHSIALRLHAFICRASPQDQTLPGPAIQHFYEAFPADRAAIVGKARQFAERHPDLLRFVVDSAAGYFFAMPLPVAPPERWGEVADSDGGDDDDPWACLSENDHAVADSDGGDDDDPWACLSENDHAASPVESTVFMPSSSADTVINDLVAGLRVSPEPVSAPDAPSLRQPEALPTDASEDAELDAGA